MQSILRQLLIQLKTIWDNTMGIDLSVIIPAFNEEENVPFVVRAFNDYLQEVNFSIELVFVDDGSSDKTIHLLRDATFSCKTTVIKLSRNFGSHAAIRAGIKLAASDCCMLYYMDLSEPIEYIGIFYEKLCEGNDIVYSDRVGYRGSLGSRLFAKLVRKYIDQSYPINGVSCLAFNGRIKEKLNENIEINSSIFFQIFQLGYTKIGIPVEIQKRERGTSKWTLSKKVKLFIDSFVMFSHMPIRLISIIGIISSGAGFVWALLIALIKITKLFEFSVGFPMISCILLIGFGMINISLGIISEYLVRTLDASRNRPVFIIEDVFRKGDDDERRFKREQEF